MKIRKKLAAGNWKMNGDGDSLGEIKTLVSAFQNPSCDILLSPPATLLARMAAVTGTSKIDVGGQDCHVNSNGANTGDISASMLADAGATYVILGHSERRADHRETDATVQSKATTAVAAGLKIIICVGETLAQQEAGDTLGVVANQLAGSIPNVATGDNLVIAYEPVWAIGTGKIPSLSQIQSVHGFIRTHLVKDLGSDQGAAVRIIYGGSVKPENAADIFAVPDVDGALVGGASLKAADFGPIIAALETAT